MTRTCYYFLLQLCVVLSLTMDVRTADAQNYLPNPYQSSGPTPLTGVWNAISHPFRYTASAVAAWTGYGGGYAAATDSEAIEKFQARLDATQMSVREMRYLAIADALGAVESAAIAVDGTDIQGQSHGSGARCLNGGLFFLNFVDAVAGTHGAGKAGVSSLKHLKAACAGVKASKAAVKPAVVAAGVKGASAKVVQSVRSCGLSKDLSDHVKGKFHGSFPAGKAKGCVPLLSAGGHIYDPSDPTTITGWIQKILQSADGQYRVPQSNITCAKQLLRNHFGIDDTVTDFDGLIANATKNVTKPGQHGCINLVLPKKLMTNKCWQNTEIYAASHGAATNTSSSGYVAGCKTIFPKDYDYHAALRHILSDPLSITDPGDRWIEGVYSGVRTKGFAAGGSINTGFPTFCQ